MRLRLRVDGIESPSWTRLDAAVFTGPQVQVINLTIAAGQSTSSWPKQNQAYLSAEFEGLRHRLRASKRKRKWRSWKTSPIRSATDAVAACHRSLSELFELTGFERRWSCCAQAWRWTLGWRRLARRRKGNRSVVCQLRVRHGLLTRTGMR